VNQFTPGPWHVGDVHGFNANIIRAENGEHISSVYGIPFNCEVSDPYLVQKRPEQFANAHLIAAAPELLEALKKLMLAKEEKAQHGDTPVYRALKTVAWDAARAAVAKAERRT
jgi:hypothetical protein